MQEFWFLLLLSLKLTGTIVCQDRKVYNFINIPTYTIATIRFQSDYRVVLTNVLSIDLHGSPKWTTDCDFYVFTYQLFRIIAHL